MAPNDASCLIKLGVFPLTGVPVVLLHCVNGDILRPMVTETHFVLNGIQESIANKHVWYRNIKQSSTVPKNLRVLRPAFHYDVAILKLTYFLKHHV